MKITQTAGTTFWRICNRHMVADCLSGMLHLFTGKRQIFTLPLPPAGLRLPKQLQKNRSSDCIKSAICKGGQYHTMNHIINTSIIWIWITIHKLQNSDIVDNLNGPEGHFSKSTGYIVHVIASHSCFTVKNWNSWQILAVNCSYTTRNERFIILRSLFKQPISHPAVLT